MQSFRYILVKTVHTIYKMKMVVVKGVCAMNEIKMDLFPGNLRAAKEREKEQPEYEYQSTMTPEEPLPESERPRKDGPGGE